MRLRALIFAFFTLTASGALAWVLAGAATRHVERQTLSELESAFRAAGMGWAESHADGLLVTVTGTAPDEATRLRAIEIARQITDPGRVTDQTAATTPDPLEPPAFALELLRNEAEVSLIGLVPASGSPTMIHDALAAGALDALVTDMLETAKYPAPDQWQESLAFGLDVLATIPRTKISVTPGQVSVIAVTDSDAARIALETDILARQPQGVRLDLEISAPRPVIAPFQLDYSWNGETGRFAACSAENEAAIREIFAAARATGLTDPDPECVIGLGAPSLDWATAAVAGIRALRELGAGRFTITDTTARLFGPPGIDADAINAAGTRLVAALPAVYTLDTVVPPRMAPGNDGRDVYAPRFEAALSDEGRISLTGAVQDRTSRDAIGSFAAALYGHDKVANASVIDPELPDGWPGRVLAGIEALASLRSGTLTVTPDLIRLDGAAVSESEEERIRTFFATKGAGLAELAIDFDVEAAKALERAAALAARPRPEICAEDIAAILGAGSITFEAGSSRIDPASSGIIAAIADVLRGCPGARFEVAGHTDSQGREEANKQLSTARAEAVMTALEAEDLPLVSLSARGYGAGVPVADNSTAAGRSSNRRIELTLVTGDAPAPDSAALTPEECSVDITEMLADGAIQFAAGLAEIADESRNVVESVAATLQTCPGAAFEIAGHTDSRGGAEGNLRLSQERADAVLSALRQSGVLNVTLTARGYGEEQPVADNDTSEGRALNRRIEMTLAGDGEAGEAALSPASPADVQDDPDSAEGCIARVAGLLNETPIAFGLGSADIDAASTEALAGIVSALGRCPEGTSVEIAGHTDDRGSAEGNLALSLERASSVRAALGEAELAGLTLSAAGYGEARPIADNETRIGRERNRRIEITLLSPPVSEPEIGTRSPELEASGPETTRYDAAPADTIPAAPADTAESAPEESEDGSQ